MFVLYRKPHNVNALQDSLALTAAKSYHQAKDSGKCSSPVHCLTVVTVKYLVLDILWLYTPTLFGSMEGTLCHMGY